MTTSNSTDFTVSRDDIIKRALRLCGVLAQGESPTTDQTSEANVALNSMIKAYMADGMPLWAIKQYSVSLTSGVNAYNIGVGQAVNTPKPLKVFQAFNHVATSNIDIPMRILSRQEYNMLGNKTTTGTPIQIFYEPLTDYGVLHVFPTPDSNAQTNNTITIVYQRPFEDFDASVDTPDFPQEWYDAITYGLAARLAGEYQISSEVRKMLLQEAAIIKQDALSFGLEEASLYFQRDNRTW